MELEHIECIIYLYMIGFKILTNPYSIYFTFEECLVVVFSD
jgi:hypothetical protein